MFAYLFGDQSTDQIGLFDASGLSIFNFSSPLLSLMLTMPLKKPRAINCPSVVHEQQVMRELTFVLGTDLSLNDQRPKSVMAHVRRTLDTGLKANACTASLWLNANIFSLKVKLLDKLNISYFLNYWNRRLPSSSAVQIITILSAPPDAKWLPSLA